MPPCAPASEIVVLAPILTICDDGCGAGSLNCEEEPTEVVAAVLVVVCVAPDLIEVVSVVDAVVVIVELLGFEWRGERT